MNLQKFCRLLCKEAEKSIFQMAARKECSHSVNLVNENGKAITMLILILPSSYDYPIYEALKPIVEKGSPGVLVAPNPNIPREPWDLPQIQN